MTQVFTTLGIGFAFAASGLVIAQLSLIAATVWQKARARWQSKAEKPRQPLPVAGK